MPILKIVEESYSNKDAMVNVINYICRGPFIGGLGVNPNCAALQMSLVKYVWYKTGGRQVRHFIVSFAGNESTDPDELMAYGYAIANYYYEKGFQVVFGVHTNTGHLHIHFAVNTVGRPEFLFVNAIAFVPRQELFSLFCGANFALSGHSGGQKGRNRLGALTFSKPPTP